MRRTILLVTTETLPAVPGAVVAGGGVRAWGLARGLEHEGHRVLLSMPRDSLLAMDRVPAPLLDLAHEPGTVTDLVWRVRPDVALFEQWGPLALLGDVPCPVIVDVPGPLLVENAYRSLGDPRSTLLAKVAALARCDHVVASSEDGARYLAPFLMLAGFDPGALPLSVVPMCFSPDAPPRSPAKEPVFVFCGVLWPWHDPWDALSALVDELERAGRGRLVVHAGAHPRNLGTGRGRGYHRQTDTGFPEEFLEQARASNRVTLGGLAPPDELAAVLAGASTAFDVMRRNTERRLATPTRTCEFLWRSLPVIHPAYSRMAPLIREAEAGWIVDPERESEIRDAVRSVLHDPAEVERRARNAGRLAHRRFNWDTACRSLSRAIMRMRRPRRNMPAFVRAALAAGRARDLAERVEALTTLMKTN